MNHNNKSEPAGSIPIPYVPYKTFQSSIERLSQADLPSRLDHSAFPSMAGTTFNQLKSTFRCLNLIDDQGVPTKNLYDLVSSAERKATLKKLVYKTYDPILNSVEIAKATPSELSEAIRRCGVSGSTAQKAQAFFLKALSECEIEVSPYIKDGIKRPASRTPRKAKPKPDQPSAKTPTAPTNGSPPVVPGERRFCIKVGKTGYAELVLAYDEFEITTEDHTELRKIVDSFKEFQERRNEHGQKLLNSGDDD